MCRAAAWKDRTAAFPHLVSSLQQQLFEPFRHERHSTRACVPFAAGVEKCEELIAILERGTGNLLTQGRIASSHTEGASVQPPCVLVPVKCQLTGTRDFATAQHSFRQAQCRQSFQLINWNIAQLTRPIGEPFEECDIPTRQIFARHGRTPYTILPQPPQSLEYQALDPLNKGEHPKIRLQKTPQDYAPQTRRPAVQAALFAQKLSRAAWTTWGRPRTCDRTSSVMGPSVSISAMAFPPGASRPRLNVATFTSFWPNNVPTAPI